MDLKRGWRQSSTGHARDGASRRLLIVEDSTTFRRSLTGALEALGYAVTRAASGAEALAIIGDVEPFDLLIVNLRLPGIDGEQVAGAARECDPEAKILFLASSPQRMGSRPTSPLLLKPFRLLELRDLCDELLSA